MIQRPPKLVVGIGNVLRHDEGVGIRVVEILANLPLPEDVEIFDGGTSALEIAYRIEQRDVVIMVDSIEAGDEAGSIYRLHPDHLQVWLRSGLSLHDLHGLDALKETQLMGTAPKTCVIYAIQTSDVSMGMGLTRNVQHALERIVQLILDELEIDVLERDLSQAIKAPSPWESNTGRCVS